MPRRKRWTIPFKSLNNTSCRIDIYEQDWTGSVETIGASSSQLVAGANPIYYEEDNDEDLLHVVRAKTGYINIVELTYGAMQPLFSQTNTQHYVEFYYNDVLMFQGYLRAENFENAWESAPRTMSLPITSPLGLADGWNFSPTGTAAGMVTLGNMMRQALEGLNSSYMYVIVPTDLTYNLSTPFDIQVNEQLIFPYSDEYNFGKGDLYQPITAKDFLEGFCHLFGLIAHDCGDTVVFQRVDYTGAYAKMEISSIEDEGYTGTPVSYSATPVSIESLFTPCNNDSRESAVNPLKQITLNYGDYEGNVSMDLTRTTPLGSGYVHFPGNETDTLVQYLKPMTDEFKSDYYSDSAANAVRPIGDGEHEYIYSRVARTNVRLFTYTFVKPPLLTFGIEFNVELKNRAFEVVIQSGGMYFDENHDWVTAEARIPMTTNDQGIGTVASVGELPGRTLSVSLVFPSSSYDTPSFLVNDIILKTYMGTPLDRYTGDNYPTTQVLPGGVSEDEGEITMLFHSAILNQHRVVDGEEGSAVVPVNYPYLFRTQLRQKRTVWLTGTTDFATIYLAYYTAYGYTGNWRIIAVDFLPWDDEYRITIHNSTTFTT